MDCPPAHHVRLASTSRAPVDAWCVKRVVLVPFVIALGGQRAHRALLVSLPRLPAASLVVHVRQASMLLPRRRLLVWLVMQVIMLLLHSKQLVHRAMQVLTQQEQAK